jgi:hypothetical protein
VAAVNAAGVSPQSREASATPQATVSSDYLDTAYQMATATGAYAATGTTSGQWMASIVTLKTG